MILKRCKHKNTRCIHGDEVNATAKGFFRVIFARVWCLDCDRPLYHHKLPEFCSVTLANHHDIPSRRAA